MEISLRESRRASPAREGPVGAATAWRGTEREKARRCWGGGGGGPRRVRDPWQVKTGALGIRPAAAAPAELRSLRAGCIEKGQGACVVRVKAGLWRLAQLCCRARAASSASYGEAQEPGDVAISIQFVRTPSRQER